MCSMAVSDEVHFFDLGFVAQCTLWLADFLSKMCTG